MGNIQKLCEHQSPVKKQQWTTAIHKQIIANRRELQESPRAPTSIQRKICELMNINKIQEIWEYSKVWLVKSPFNFCYVNEPINSQKVPINKTAIFLYREKGQFTGFFYGMVNQKGQRSSLSSIYVYENGDYFIGDPQKQNYGKYIDQQMNYEYQGEWTNQQPHGKGTQTSPKGIFKGMFFQGKKNQQGVMKFANNQGIVDEQNEDYLQYEGQFKNDEINGYGKLFNRKTDYEYVGQFLKGQKHGIGVQKAGNYIYDGHYYQNKKMGSGKLIMYRNDTQYQGNFQNDLPNGKGKLKNKYEELQGIWKDGQMIAILNKIK